MWKERVGQEEEVERTRHTVLHHDRQTSRGEKEEQAPQEEVKRPR
jgi:hypothetical protein